MQQSPCSPQSQLPAPAGQSWHLRAAFRVCATQQPPPSSSRRNPLLATPAPFLGATAAGLPRAALIKWPPQLLPAGPVCQPRQRLFSTTTIQTGAAAAPPHLNTATPAINCPPLTAAPALFLGAAAAPPPPAAAPGAAAPPAPKNGWGVGSGGRNYLEWGWVGWGLGV